MKLHILPFFALTALLSCDRSTNESADSSDLRSVSARVSRDASVTESLFDSASAVHVKLATVNGTVLADDTVLFSKHSIPTVSAPSDQGVVVSMEGLTNTLAVLWNGSVTLPPSTRDTSFAITVSAVSAANGGLASGGTVNAPTLDSTSVKAWATGSSVDTFDQPVHVFLSSLTSEAEIHYTLDGSNPTASSPTYRDTGILIDSSRALEAIAIKTGFTASTIVSRKIVLQVRPVAIAADGNVGWPPFKIGLSCSTAGVVIHYTTDGTAPSIRSAVYIDGLTFPGNDSLTYRAIAIDTLHPKVVPSTASSCFGPMAPWNSSVTYGRLTDSRDGQVYRTVTIGTQTWMAQNLNYKTDNSRCYDNDTNNCHKYGRLYPWVAAMDLASTYDSTPWSGSLPHQGICPSGWHVPADAEWSKLIDTALDSSTAGIALKSTSSLWTVNTGTDVKGFHALPAGYYGGAYVNINSYTLFWSASEDNAFLSWGQYVGGAIAYIDRSSIYKAYGLSLRCVKDN